ncbi:hypothetical protein NPIL_518541 [Nephila pilipes]|uniref:Uncharacterized protein n=1 Tax=Nephila pilipes TaxID=299642 RepID=A0A8X6NPA1_NEPPI|nr:hypothetical protein NPIL_518541 [Nephila pilipes]
MPVRERQDLCQCRRIRTYVVHQEYYDLRIDMQLDNCLIALRIQGKRCFVSMQWVVTIDVVLIVRATYVVCSASACYCIQWVILFSPHLTAFAFLVLCTCDSNCVLLINIFPIVKNFALSSLTRYLKKPVHKREKLRLTLYSIFLSRMVWNECRFGTT